MTLPAGVVQRDCALYRIWARDPSTNYTTTTLGYIGETARQPLVRLMEHLLEQPWSDTIVGWEVDPVVYASKAAVLAAEEAAVVAERPLYNIEFNMGNPDRVPPWEAQEQRLRRDGGRPQRRQRPRVSDRTRPGRGRSRTAPRLAVRRGRGWRVRPFGYALLWLVVAGGLCWTVVDRVGARDGFGLGAAGATALFVAAVGTRRRRRP